MRERESRFLGVTVLGDFILSEGVEAVLENLHRIGATAVACNPTVTAPANDGEGTFQPPVDAGSSPRVFDRPLFGRTSLWVTSGPSFRPKPDYYADSSYGPRHTNDLTSRYGAVIGRFIDEAAGSGLKVYLQVGAAQPSGLRDEDRPRLPDGRIAANRMADTASLASPAVRAYNRAYIRDLLEAYPGITGFRPDWPESPCYTLGEAFQDFGPHVASWANHHGFDFKAIRRDVGELWTFLHGGLSTDDLRDFAGQDGGKFRLVSLLTRFPGAAEWLRLKAALSADLLRDWRNAITEFGGRDKQLAANAFMPPYSLLTGFDFAEAARICSSVAPKLYTMHWSLMVKFWGEELMAANAGLDEATLVRALVNVMDLRDERPERELSGASAATEHGRPPSCRLSDYGYPLPDEPHPIPDGPQRRKIGQACRACGPKTPVYPLVHGYGPADDFRRRLQLVAEEDVDGVWINRYGYLSDAKLSIIADLWR